MDAPDDRGRQPWGPRILAPLAFLAAATVLVLLVNSALDNGSEAATPADPPGTARTETSLTGTGDTTETPPGQREFHRIRPGDTLEGIANRYETTVDDLLRLNPNIEPNNLSPGQRIRVR